MSVFVEFINVLVPVEALNRTYPGGAAGYERRFGRGTYCSDGVLTRVGFMSPIDTKRFVDQLERRGLRFMRDGKALDLVVVDQLMGPTTPCDWVEFEWPGDGPPQAWVKGQRGELAMPRGRGSTTFEDVEGVGDPTGGRTSE